MVHRIMYDTTVAKAGACKWYWYLELSYLQDLRIYLFIFWPTR